MTQDGTLDRSSHHLQVTCQCIQQPPVTISVDAGPPRFAMQPDKWWCIHKFFNLAFLNYEKHSAGLFSSSREAQQRAIPLSRELVGDYAVINERRSYGHAMLLPRRCAHTHLALCARVIPNRFNYGSNHSSSRTWSVCVGEALAAQLGAIWP